MLITSTYSISRYTGTDSLSLMAAPTSLTATQLTQYNKFISNVVSIYGNVLPNGTVPIFYKNADGTPSTNSTLTSLNSDNEYYILSKLDAVFPYIVPVLGTQTDSSSNSCPIVSFPSNSVDLSSPNQIYAYVTANVSGLNIGQTYNYKVEGVGSNWPSKVSPLSGTIVPSNTTYDLDLVFNYSPVSGVDSSKFLPFVLDPDADKDYIRSNLYSIVKLSVSGADCYAGNDSVMMKCNNCLPTSSSTISRPTLSFIGGPKISLSNTCCSSPVPVVLNVTNCVPGRQYSYQFGGFPDGSVTITPANGSVGFGGGGGNINAIVDTAGQKNTVIRCSITDNVLNETFSEFLAIQCSTGGC